jgi:hypothetical protein
MILCRIAPVLHFLLNGDSGNGDIIGTELNNKTKANKNITTVHVQEWGIWK